MKSTSPVRSARKSLKLTLVYVARACRISVSSLSNIERGLLRTRADVAARLAKFYSGKGIDITEEHILFPERFKAHSAPQASRGPRPTTPPRRRPAA